MFQFLGVPIQVIIPRQASFLTMSLSLDLLLNNMSWFLIQSHKACSSMPERATSFCLPPFTSLNALNPEMSSPFLAPSLLALLNLQDMLLPDKFPPEPLLGKNPTCDSSTGTSKVEYSVFLLSCCGLPPLPLFLLLALGAIFKDI